MGFRRDLFDFSHELPIADVYMIIPVEFCQRSFLYFSVQLHFRHSLTWARNHRHFCKFASCFFEIANHCAMSTLYTLPEDFGRLAFLRLCCRTAPALWPLDRTPQTEA
jgi:hypothetical protein